MNKERRNHPSQQEIVKYLLELTGKVRRDGVMGDSEKLECNDLLMMQHVGKWSDMQWLLPNNRVYFL